MSGLSSVVQELAAAAGKLGGQAADILRDRLELVALELREDKIRVVQVLMLAILGTGLVLFGLVLLLVAGVYALPPEWRLTGLVLAGAATILAGGLALGSLRRRLVGRGGVFVQSLEELKKDRECF